MSDLAGEAVRRPPNPAAEARPAAPADSTNRAFLLAIVGDSGSGKNTVADAVERLLDPSRVTNVHLDDYHRFSRAERTERGMTALNPLAHNLPLMQEHLTLLGQGRPIRNRSYRHIDGSFGPIRTIEPAQMVLVRGLLGFPTAELQRLYGLTIFLQPEPELLFRWKMRRDVLFRGYQETEVLNSIARHLLDSKEYVLPQAERADLFVHYSLPEWDAPDSEVRTTLRLRTEIAERVDADSILEGLGLDREESGEGWTVRVPALPSFAEIDRWAERHFPESYPTSQAGTFFDEAGQLQRNPALALVEVLIAELSDRLTRLS